MSKADNKYQSSLGKARGLGSAHEGAHHWLSQRVTAISNFFLVTWLVYSIVQLRGATYEEFTGWLAMPLNATLFILFILSTFYHAVLGTQVITEDYVPSHGTRLVTLIVLKLAFAALGVASIVSILKVAL